MCGRYASITPPDAIRRMVKAVNVAPNFAANWNLAPTQQGLVVRRHPETGERHLDALAWGFLANWNKELKDAVRLINTRAETLGTSAMFRPGARARWCLFTADVFYEWHTTEHGKQPYAISRQDGNPLMVAGVWDGWRGPAGEIIRSYTIVTCPANATMASLHDRMPVILEAADWPLWLGEVEGDAMTLMQPAAAAVLPGIASECRGEQRAEQWRSAPGPRIIKSVAKAADDGRRIMTGYMAMGLALIGLGTGLRAASLWYQSTKVEVVPSWASWGVIEPTDPNQATIGWIIGQWEADKEAAGLNARAAKWTAAAVILSGLASVAGSWPPPS